METFRDGLRQLKQYPLTVLFFAFLAVFFIVGLLLPDQDVSQLENRSLTQRPVFDAAALADGYDGFATAASAWTIGYNEYAKDQLPLRDSWISMQSLLESAQGKLENGGVWYAGDNYLIAKNTVLSETQQRTLPLNTGAVAELAARHPGKVTAMIVPSPASTLSELLPFNPPQIDENALLDDTFAAFTAAGAQVVDLRAAMASDPLGLYYHTDHHWTTLGGALLGYEQYCDLVGREALLPDETLLRRVEGFLGTNYAKSKKPFTAPETMFYYDLPNELTVFTLDAAGEAVGEPGPLMDASKFEEYDKYAAFLRGNNGYSELEGDGEGSILLIKDSYGNCFAPYLAANYEKVGIIDLRAWAEVDRVIEEEGYDEVLVLYSFDNFSADPYARRMLTEVQQTSE